MNDDPKFWPIDALNAYPEPVGTLDKLELSGGAVWVHLNGKRAKLVGLQSLAFLIGNLQAIHDEVFASAEPSAPVERDERAEFEIASVLGFPSYSVSSDGIVYRNDSGNAISQQANSKGYLTVNLSEAGKATRRTVHRVVLESFVGVRPEGFQALHGDGNPANNRLSNLRWGAPSENEADKALHGTKAIGSRNGASRLTEAMVQEILEAKRVGGKKWGAGRLAKKFGVDISTVTRAARGKHWAEARAALERNP